MTEHDWKRLYTHDREYSGVDRCKCGAFRMEWPTSQTGGTFVYFKPGWTAPYEPAPACEEDS